MKVQEQITGFFAWLVLCLIAMAAGGYATSTSLNDWYANLNKPVWTPPDWVFAPVWITLYILLAIAVWLVWRERQPGKKVAIIFFVFMLLLNILWSFVFFAARNPLAGSIEIVVLWLLSLSTLALFFKQSRMAGFLFLPYFIWVTFAAVLNISIWRMNL